MRRVAVVTALKKVFEDYDWNKLLAEAGLVGEDEESHRRYDRFRDRVIFSDS